MDKETNAKAALEILKTAIGDMIDEKKAIEEKLLIVQGKNITLYRENENLREQIREKDDLLKWAENLRKELARNEEIYYVGGLVACAIGAAATLISMF